MNPANRSLATEVRGPLILITIGVLFLLDRFTRFGFGQTWPIILIIIGLLTLVGGSRRRSVGPGAPPLPPDVPPPGGWR